MPSFVEIGLPVLEKKNCRQVFTIRGHDGRLGHVTSLPIDASYEICLDWPSSFREDNL